MALAVGKVIIAVATTGVIGTVGVGSLVYFTEPKEQSIEELLASSSPKKTLLTNKNKNEGTKAWEKYKVANANQEGDWKIEDWKTEGAKGEFNAGLVKVCEKRKQDKVKRVTDEAYINFVNWCTKEAE